MACNTLCAKSYSRVYAFLSYILMQIHWVHIVKVLDNTVQRDYFHFHLFHKKRYNFYEKIGIQHAAHKELISSLGIFIIFLMEIPWIHIMISFRQYCLAVSLSFVFVLQKGYNFY